MYLCMYVCNRDVFLCYRKRNACTILERIAVRLCSSVGHGHMAPSSDERGKHAEANITI